MGTRTILLSVLVVGFVLLSYLKKEGTLIAWIARYKWMLLLFLPVLFYAKLNSSLGRMHIWKLSWQLLQGQSMWRGIGSNKFNLHYNHLQASYFKEHGLASKEAMLANDGYYAFNELMHFGIEQGWWAAILLLLLFCLFIYQNWRLIKRQGSFNVEFFCTLLLWPIVVGCWVGYPLHNPYWAIYAIAATLMLFASIFLPQKAFLLKGTIVGMGAIALFAVGLQVSKVRRFNGVLEEAKELWLIGDKSGAINGLYSFCKSHPTAIPHNEVLVKWLWLLGKEEEAIGWMQRHHQLHCNQRMHETLGMWYAWQKNWKQASQHLHTSLYITPHLLRSRAVLADFYFLKNDNDSAKYWAQEVASYPAKMKNQQAAGLKQSATVWLLQAHPLGSPFQLLN